MNIISISQLKTKPAYAISLAIDYPVAVQSRSQTKAYLIGKNLYEKFIDQIEDKLDRRAIADTNFNTGKDFNQLTEELGL